MIRSLPLIGHPPWPPSKPPSPTPPLLLNFLAKKPLGGGIEPTIRICQEGLCLAYAGIFCYLLMFLLSQSHIDYADVDSSCYIVCSCLKICVSFGFQTTRWKPTTRKYHTYLRLGGLFTESDTVPIQSISCIVHVSVCLSPIWIFFLLNANFLSNRVFPKLLNYNCLLLIFILFHQISHSGIRKLPKTFIVGGVAHCGCQVTYDKWRVTCYTCI